MMKYLLLPLTLFAYACGGDLHGEYGMDDLEAPIAEQAELVASDAAGLNPKTPTCGPDTRFGWTCPLGYECVDEPRDGCDGSVDLSCSFICVRKR